MKLCKGGGCPKKDECYRFTSIKENPNGSYIKGTPYLEEEVGVECMYFWKQYKLNLDKVMEYKELERAVEGWAKEKGILDKATPMKQALKTLEEVAELINAIEDEDKYEIADALGDILVTIIIQAKMNNMDLTACLRDAYTIISRRTGAMVNGQFVKDN